MPEKKHCYHSSAYHSPVCDLDIYSKLWAVDSLPGVCLPIMICVDTDDVFHDHEAII